MPFTGKPYDKLLIKQGHVRIMSKVLSLPDVQIGSILEYRYKVNAYIPTPEWSIQQQVPVLKAHYNFRPDAHGSNLLSSFRLPDGDKVVKGKHGSFDLTVEKVPALPDEDFLPPLGKFSYSVSFYYSWVKTSDEYWKDPVDMHYPYQVNDQFNLTLPSNFTVENLPREDSVLLPPSAGYAAKFAASGNTFAYGRLFRVASAIYKTTEYQSLRDFFQKVSSDDQQQVVLKTGSSPSAVGNE